MFSWLGIEEWREAQLNWDRVILLGAPPPLFLQRTEFNNIDCSSLFWCWFILLSCIETLLWSNSCELHEIILTDKDISVYCMQADILEIKMCERPFVQNLVRFLHISDTQRPTPQSELLQHSSQTWRSFHPATAPSFMSWCLQFSFQLAQ